MQKCCVDSGSSTASIEAGSPWEHPFVERLNRRFWDEFLTIEQFTSVPATWLLAEPQRIEDHPLRPLSEELDPQRESRHPCHQWNKALIGEHHHSKGLASLISRAWMGIRAAGVLSRRGALVKSACAPWQTQCKFLKRPSKAGLIGISSSLRRCAARRQWSVCKHPLKEVLVFCRELLVSVGVDHLSASGITDSGA